MPAMATCTSAERWNRHMFQKASPMVRPTVRTPWFRITSTVFSRPRLAKSRGFSPA